MRGGWETGMRVDQNRRRCREGSGRRAVEDQWQNFSDGPSSLLVSRFYKLHRKRAKYWCTSYRFIMKVIVSIIMFPSRSKFEACVSRWRASLEWQNSCQELPLLTSLSSVSGSFSFSFCKRIGNLNGSSFRFYFSNYISFNT